MDISSFLINYSFFYYKLQNNKRGVKNNNTYRLYEKYMLL
ncbi:hypothetical protein HMPREF3033_00263 [Veillonellaceae bacterium DNF00751]|nr:hypothetical protein HMPREF3033_00263 [Veillonellaceae bacterium DNF00751]